MHVQDAEQSEALAAQAEIRAELRGAIGASGEYHYQIAARAKLHPALLSAILRGRRPLTKDVERRLRAAIRPAPTRRRA